MAKKWNSRDTSLGCHDSNLLPMKKNRYKTRIRCHWPESYEGLLSVGLCPRRDLEALVGYKTICVYIYIQKKTFQIPPWIGSAFTDFNLGLDIRLVVCF